ncbi:DUF6036 family nucleotidyltransferase [Aliikangiella sp. IMCC44359]|uniref:DUF6036 family nucleotidyltransferase n=1 Tax=Aliikangiella sp. IMCC44359 TaxID=3459125 RepID=UPI00403AB475
MALDKAKIERVFQLLGEELDTPTILCVFGSSPAILSGQLFRKTQRIDVWYTNSVYDSGKLSRACVKVGILYDPKGEVEPGSIYFQIVRSGFVALPKKFETETLAQFGNLKLVMPAPAIISASKLVRANDNDIRDVVWWIRQRNIKKHEIDNAISNFPDSQHRKIAKENMVFVQLVSKGG